MTKTELTKQISAEIAKLSTLEDPLQLIQSELYINRLQQALTQLEIEKISKEMAKNARKLSTMQLKLNEIDKKTEKKSKRPITAALNLLKG